MSISLFIARRYVLTRERHHFFSFISILTMAGVTLGTASMIVVLSVIGGFEREFRERFLAANAHILMFDYPKGLNNYSEVAREAKQTLVRSHAITGLSPFIHMETMVKKTDGLVSTLVRGIHPSKRQKVQPYAHLISPQSALDRLENEVINYQPDKTSGVILGVGLAHLLDASLGDVVRFLVPAEDSGILGLYQNFEVIGFYDSGLSHYDNKLAILSIPGAQSLFDMNGFVTGVEMGLKEPWLSRNVEARLRNQFPGMMIKNWQDYNQSFFEAIQYEKVLISLLVALVALVSGFNILTTLFVSVFQKERDIMLLLSLGSTKKQVMAVFLYQGFCMGVIGSTIGCGLAYLLARAIETYQFISLPQVYMLAKLPVEYNLVVYLLTAACSLVIATLAGVLPAFAAIKGDVSHSLKSR